MSVSLTNYFYSPDNIVQSALIVPLQIWNEFTYPACNLLLVNQ